MTMQLLETRTSSDLTAFKKAIVKDPLLQEQLKGAVDRSNLVKMAVSLGCEYGYEISPEEVETAIASASKTYDCRSLSGIPLEEDY